MSEYRVVPLDHTHDRSTFDCGSDVLNSYFREHVTQDIRRRIANCFVALSSTGRISGFYTLASASIFLGDLPANFAKKLPRYPSVPAVRMGRLAVHRASQGQGLGGVLLADALIRVVRSEIAAYALVVDAKDEKAAEFYRRHGFLETVDKPLVLFLPLATVRPFLKEQ
jgi:GNAT superfamily N-acetyltransferase